MPRRAQSATRPGRSWKPSQRRGAAALRCPPVRCSRDAEEAAVDDRLDGRVVLLELHARRVRDLHAARDREGVDRQPDLRRAGEEARGAVAASEAKTHQSRAAAALGRAACAAA
eukprot:3819424-Prymnesium_polylepis.2